MATQFTVSATLPASPREVYDAWLTSKNHAAMTASPARVTARLGARFTAWDGYIAGRNVKLVPARRIVQAWRTAEFADTDPDSQIDVKLEKSARGTKLTLRHTNIPGGQSDYKTGWSTCYFEPMKAYFKVAKKKG